MFRLSLLDGAEMFFNVAIRQIENHERVDYTVKRVVVAARIMIEKLALEKAVVKEQYKMLCDVKSRLNAVKDKSNDVVIKELVSMKENELVELRRIFEADKQELAETSV